MSWGEAGHLLWLWLIVPVAIAGYWAWRSRWQRLQRFSQWRMDMVTSRPLSRTIWGLKVAMLCLAIAALVIALAKPRMGFQWLQVKSKGVDIIVAVDVSRSMLAEDVKPNRLERAKREILDFLNLVRGDRIGLMAFAGVPFVQCPLTVDYGAVAMFLDYLTPELIPVPGTALGMTVERAVKSFEEAANEHSQGRALILITDGEDHDDAALSKAIEGAKKADVRVYVVGIGDDQGAPIPLARGGFLKDKSGNIVVSKLAEDGLKNLASATGGRYVRSTAGDLDLDLIYRQGIKDALEDLEFDAKRRKLWYERFQWFVGLAFLLLVGEALWREQGRAILASLIVGLSLVSSSGALEAADLKGAHDAFEKKDFDQAAKKFEEAEIDDPDNLEHSYNRAVSQYRDQEFDGARQGFARSAQSSDKGLAGRSYYNLGNTEFRLGNLEGAVAAFEETLKLNPEDQEAKENLEFVKRMLEEQKQKQQGDGQDQKQGQSSDQKNSQQQGQQEQNASEGQQNQGQQEQSSGEGEKSQEEQSKQGQKQSNEEGQQPEEGASSQDGEEVAEPGQGEEDSESTEGAVTGNMDEKAARRTLESVDDAAGKYLGRPDPDDLKRGRQQYRGKEW